jgi:hypothetical protein
VVGIGEEGLMNYMYNECKVGTQRLDLDVDIKEMRNTETTENDGDDEVIETEDDKAVKE